jgi:hypothetical protein
METDIQRITPSTSMQLSEQQEESPEQSSPAGMQVLVEIAQVPDSQELLQQSTSAVHSSLTMAQVPSAQEPPTQERLQHSAARMQEPPRGTQPPGTQIWVLLPATASQRPEQHSAEATQVSPRGSHDPVGSRQTPLSQRPEQHALGAEQEAPVARHWPLDDPSPVARSPLPPSFIGGVSSPSAQAAITIVIASRRTTVNKLGRRIGTIMSTSSVENRRSSTPI